MQISFYQKIYFMLIAPVAQLDRASASGAEGYRFNSYQALHNLIKEIK